MHIGYQIIADGADVTGRFQDRLISMTIKDEAGQKSDTAEIEVDNRDYALALPKVGAKLDLAMGLGGVLVPMGRYVVDELSGEIFPSTLTISAKAADMRGSIRSRKTRAWKNVTLGQILDQIAGEHGLTPVISDSLKAAGFAYLAQTSESDLHFLTRLARDLDAVAKPASGHLIVVQRGAGQAGNGAALPVFRIHRSQMSGARFDIKSRAKPGKVVAQWGERASGKVHKVSAGKDSPQETLRHRYATKSEAERAANAALSRGKRSSGSISVDLGGFWGALMAEAKVDLQGIPSELCGEWLITSVTHTLNGSLTTSFNAERDQEESSDAAS